MEQPTYRFHEPKRKRQQKWQTSSGHDESPFPVPIASILGLPASNARWNYFTGRLVGISVHIDGTANAGLLYQMVFHNFYVTLFI